MLKIENPRWKELINNSFWSVGGAIASKGLLFLVWILVGRILGSASYGEFGIIRNTVLMFATFSGFGLGLTATKFVSEYMHRDRNMVVTTINVTYFFGIFMGILISVLFYLFSQQLSVTLKAPQLLFDLKICSIILFFSSLNGIQIGILQGFQKFKEIAKVNIIQSIICFPLYILGAIYFGVHGAVIAFLVSYILICILCSFFIKDIFAKNNITFSFLSVKKGFSILYTYSLPTFISGLMVSPIKWICDTILISSAGFKSMGIFTAALTFNNIVMVMASMISGPLLTTLASKKDNENKTDVNIERFNLLFPWYLSILISLPLIYFFEIGHSMFGDSYEVMEFRPTFIVALFFTIIMMFKEGLTRIVAVNNLQWWSLFSNLIWGLSLVTFVYFYVGIDSTTMAIGYTLAYSLNILVLFPIFNKRNLIPKNSILGFDSLLIWLLLLSSAIFCLQNYTLYIRIIVFCIVLCLVVYIVYKKFIRIKNESN